jgi:bifunctional UDP-N-acetylglucosamine pyrophosphorylase/glucosamine-1-phosphate N-acetyltransferase
MNIIILAAGKGTRMRSDLPKVLHPIAGVPMLGHVLRTAQQLNPARIVIVHGHGAELVRNAFVNEDIHWVLQQPQLGTGHAVQVAENELLNDVPSLVLYGDVPLIRKESLQRLLAACNNEALAVMTMVVDDPAGYGRILRNERGDIVGIVEEKDANPEQKRVREVNTGILIAPTTHLKRWLSGLSNQNVQGEYYLTDIIEKAAREGFPLRSCQPTHPWEVLGVNARHQQAELERVYQREQANALMAQGVRLADPNRIDVRGELICGRDVFIDVGCVFEGHVTLADGVRVGPYCVLKDVSIGKQSQLAAYTHCDSATVGEAAVLGPFARLRPGTALADHVHVGNFVEIKNSSVASHSKANHLSYIGDATVGERVNIGAGTITCNYDGVNKHRTVIEDDVFIGSDTQLIAPVTVAKGATLGAGTTLVLNAPAGQLTLSRAHQVTVPSWKRAVKLPKKNT